MTLAYKVLCAGGLGPFSGYAWPLPRGGRPGAWVTAPAHAVACRTAVHACRPGDLPWWLQEEIWEAELGGPVAAGRHKVMAPRARLLRRVEAWDAECARRFAEACAARARDHAARALERAGDDAGAAALAAARGPREQLEAIAALGAPSAAHPAVTTAGDAAASAIGGEAVVVAYIAAHAAARLEGAAAMAAEREWQAGWLRDELGLGTAGSG